jgi:hypothetical protein
MAVLWCGRALEVPLLVRDDSTVVGQHLIEYAYRFYFPQRKRTEVRRFVDAVMAWDFDSIVTSHLDIVIDDAKQEFARAFEFITI